VGNSDSRIARRSAEVAAALLLTFAVTGCARPAGEDRSTGPVTVAIGIAAPQGGFDPGISVVADFLSVESLVTLNNDGRAAPNLAARWEQSVDGLEWRFALREGITLHDGTPLNAARVSEILNKALRQPAAVAIGPSFQHLVSVLPAGATSFTIKLSRPSALLLSDLAYVNITNVTGEGRTIGTGPFVVESRDDRRIVLRRFDAFRDGAPAIERVELNAFPTVRNAWTALMRGEVDFLYEVGADAAEFVDGESSVQTFTFLRPYTLTLGFNMRHPALKSREVRQSLNRAVDRDAIIKAAFRGRGRPAQDPIWPHHWASGNATKTYTFNREAAVLGFTAAGFRGLKQVGGRMPSRFEFNCLVYPPLERVALLIQKQLSEAGVDMSIELADRVQLGQRIGRGDYDAVLVWQTTGRSLTWPYLFWHSPEAGRPAFLQTGYVAADATLENIRYARTDEDLRNAVAAFQQVIHDDPPAIFLAWEERVRAVSRKFHVPPPEPGRDVVASLWRWRPAAPASARAQ
jgi:peptide/nickel transport system substrate-binding protein